MSQERGVPHTFSIGITNTSRLFSPWSDLSLLLLLISMNWASQGPRLTLCQGVELAFSEPKELGVRKGQLPRPPGQCCQKKSSWMSGPWEGPVLRAICYEESKHLGCLPPVTLPGRDRLLLLFEMEYFICPRVTTNSLYN